MKTGSISVMFQIDVGRTNKGAVSGIFINEWIVLINHSMQEVLLYDGEGKFLTKLKCTFRPYDVAELSQNEICVTAFNSKDLCIISVPDVTISRTISAHVPCYGIDYHDYTFLFGLKSGITIAKLQGENIEEEKTIPTNGHNHYVKSVNQDQYIYADGKKTVISTTKDKRLFTYTNDELSSPRGIDVDFQGNIYICGQKSNNIHQISYEGKLIRIIKASDLKTQSPWVIRFQKKSNMFLLTSLESGKVVVCEIA